MHTGRIIFSQILDFLPRYEFNKCVQRYQGNYRTRKFSCYDQFLCMAFAQLTYRESLRDIETCLRALRPKLYHAGIRSQIARSTLAEANENRDWRIYSDFAQGLIQHARQLYAHEDFGVTLDHAAYAFDSTTIDLCLSLFPWAQFRRHKAAIKIHTLMDLHGSIPCFIRITSGKIHDVRILDELPLEPGSFYIMDRAYIDFGRLYTFTQQSAFFVTRAKSNLDYIRRSHRHVDKATGVKSDQTIALVGPRTSLEYPDCLRRISYFDSENKKRLVFLTNNFMLPPLTVAQLYRCRWQVELFFKWIKQHLRIKAFYGTSENAIKTQIWIAISIYVLVAILKKELNLDRNLNEILQILSITIFENSPIYQVLSDFCLSSENQHSENQLFYLILNRTLLRYIIKIITVKIVGCVYVCEGPNAGTNPQSVLEQDIWLKGKTDRPIKLVIYIEALCRHIVLMKVINILKSGGIDQTDREAPFSGRKSTRIHKYGKQCGHKKY